MSTSKKKIVKKTVKKKEPEVKPPVKLTIKVVYGCDGPSLYIDGYRAIGPKPWGFEGTFHTFEIDKERFLRIVNEGSD